MDEVRISWRFSPGAHLTSDLSAMIRRVQQHVRQNIFHRAAPKLALAVFVGDLLRERCGRKPAEEFAPKVSDVCDLRFALVNGEIWPHGQALRLVPDAFHPKPLGGNNVRQKLQRPRGGASTCPYVSEYFAVRPRVIAKLTTQMFQQVHDS